MKKKTKTKNPKKLKCDELNSRYYVHTNVQL